MKVMSTREYLAFAVRENPFAVAGSSSSSFKRKRPQNADPVDSTDKERIVDGW
jgi:hypothetical protein